MADMLKSLPEINQKFVDFYCQIFKDGVLSLKTKEKIAERRRCKEPRTF